MTKTKWIETRLEICCVLRSVLCRYENNKFAVYQIYSTNLQLGAVGVSRKGGCIGVYKHRQTSRQQSPMLSQETLAAGQTANEHKNAN